MISPNTGNTMANSDEWQNGHARQAPEPIDGCLDPALDRLLGRRFAALARIRSASLE